MSSPSHCQGLDLNKMSRYNRINLRKLGGCRITLPTSRAGYDAISSWGCDSR